MSALLSRAALIGAGSIVALLFASPDGRGWKAADATQSRVAVVDVVLVLSTAKPFVAADTALRAWIDDVKRVFKARDEELKKAAADLEVFSPDSEEFKSKSRELDRKRLEFQQDFEEKDRERLRRITDSQKAAWDQASAAIAEYAKAQGIEVVLQLRKGDFAGKTQEQVSAEMYLRDVLYADPALDITSTILSILNR